MTRPGRHPLTRFLVVATAALGTVVVSTTSAGAAGVTLVADPASLVNPFLGTSGAVDTFPGPDMPFGMMQWSPDTSPHRAYGGGYEYDDSALSGFSLTHLSGPGCGAYGDIPILPTVGAVGSSPSSTTVGFSHATESAGIGYYDVGLANGVDVRLTDSQRSGIGEFEFPASQQSNLLLKVSGSADTVAATTASVIGDDEVTGSVTAGRFCGAPTSYENNYTLHFDITFDHPFSASGTWGGTSSSAVEPGSTALRQRATALSASARATLPSRANPDRRASGVTFAGAGRDFTPAAQPSPTGSAAVTPPAEAVANPGGVYLTFDTTHARTITAKVGISFTGDANARRNRRAEIPDWNFARVEHANQAAWNALLGRIRIGGGSHTAQTEFYTALYHTLLHPNVFSDVNGQYEGFDGKIHTTPRGHPQYANYSGWDIYRSQVQLAALVAPRQTSDSISSMLNDYAQSGLLPRWALGNGESYVMPGDSSDPIIADAYAFGARDFDQAAALRDMIAEAGSDNNNRPGTTQLDTYGYLPSDGRYGAWYDYGAVSTQLEYDTDDYAIAAFAEALGDASDYTRFATRAQDWRNVFDVASGYMQPRLSSGQWAPGFTPSSTAQFTEGTSAQYTAMVPFDLRALIDAKGGDPSYDGYLDGLLADITKPGGTNANLGNEPSFDIPWQYDYTGEPYRTQAIVRQAQQELYFDAPVAQAGNDDLGAMSSWYVWSELGMYPETPGSPTLVFGSPVFPKTLIHLATGRTLTINAPNAAPGSPYVRSLSMNGHQDQRDWTTAQVLGKGGTWTFDLASTPNTSWGTGVLDAPPSDSTGYRPASTSGAPGGRP